MDPTWGEKKYGEKGQEKDGGGVGARGHAHPPVATLSFPRSIVSPLGAKAEREVYSRTTKFTITIREGEAADELEIFLRDELASCDLQLTCTRSPESSGEHARMHARTHTHATRGNSRRRTSRRGGGGGAFDASRENAKQTSKYEASVLRSTRRDENVVTPPLPFPRRRQMASKKATESKSHGRKKNRGRKGISIEGESCADRSCDIQAGANRCSNSSRST